MRGVRFNDEVGAVRRLSIMTHKPPCRVITARPAASQLWRSWVLVACLLGSVNACSFSAGFRTGTSPAETRVVGAARPIAPDRARTLDREPPKVSAAAPPVRRPSPRARVRAASVNSHSRGASPVEAACYADLRRAAVPFEIVAKDRANGVAWPIRLTGPVAGIQVHGGAKPNAPSNYLDCRLAQALLEWAPELRRAGVVGLRHYSMFRQGARVAGTSKQSAHALGTAIDVARFELRDGGELSVLDDWTNRERGADPCLTRGSDTAAARLMRRLVCRASQQDLFQTVITPHYNDAHRNHVHLEIDPSQHGRFIG